MTHQIAKEFACRYKDTYIHDIQTYDPTQPTENKNFQPRPDQPDPTQPAVQPNPRTTL